jgi:hypothetical protein
MTLAAFTTAPRYSSCWRQNRSSSCGLDPTPFADLTQAAHHFGIVHGLVGLGGDPFDDRLRRAGWREDRGVTSAVVAYERRRRE